ncbi:MAG: hypothetical protein F6J87_16060 [Spirulina sp. SIO3F2]|nr:hypothetical protein [Spirulina sp. SIO3F2]
MPPSLPLCTAESTLRELPLHYFQVSPQSLGKKVAQQFEQEPWLPGVIIADEQWFWGMISRRRFNEWMSSPYEGEIPGITHGISPSIISSAHRWGEGYRGW